MEWLWVIAKTVLILAAIAFVLGVLLAVASKIFAVKKDEREEAVVGVPSRSPRRYPAQTAVPAVLRAAPHTLPPLFMTEFRQTSASQAGKRSPKRFLR